MGKGKIKFLVRFIFNAKARSHAWHDAKPHDKESFFLKKAWIGLNGVE
jgi:hypothetical protein